MALNKNKFEGLVRAYGKQRGYTQEVLAERWGHSRAYVSLIEAGKKKLDSIVWLKLSVWLIFWIFLL